MENHLTNLWERITNQQKEVTPLQEKTQAKQKELKQLISPIKESGLFASYSVIEANNVLEGISVATQTSTGMFYPPNVIFLTMSSNSKKDKK